MDNGLHALETVPKGHFMAFGGEVVKKSCEVCGYFYHHQEYSHHELGCNLGDGNHPMQFLPSWPFKNGCRYFEPHYAFTTDWDEEARLDEEDNAICRHRSRGKCFCYGECEHKTANGDEYPTCAKGFALASAPEG